MKLQLSRTPNKTTCRKTERVLFVEAARDMLIAAKVPLFLLAEAIATHVLPQTVPRLDGENLDKMKEKGIGYRQKDEKRSQIGQNRARI
ncbi:hypothetical protein Tco_1243741 [Tanacetum coccineum]